MPQEKELAQLAAKLPMQLAPSATTSMSDVKTVFYSAAAHTPSSSGATSATRSPDALPMPSGSDEGTADDSDDDLEWEEWNPNQISFLSHMLAGSMAGLAEHVCLYPVDTIKTHIQCQRCGTSLISSWASTLKMIRKEGVFRLWRGVSAMFAGCIPAHAAFFSIYESTRRLVGADQSGHHPVGAAIAGACAALSHDMLITPFDVAKQRLQLGYYRDVRHCMREILRTEGIGAFYVSLPTTLFMNLPHGGIVVAVNESMRKVLNPSGKYDLVSSMIAGCSAGAVAAAITTPLDVIKTKLQTRNIHPCGEENADKCIKTVQQRYSVSAHTVVSEEVVVPRIECAGSAKCAANLDLDKVVVDRSNALASSSTSTTTTPPVANSAINKTTLSNQSRAFSAGKLSKWFRSNMQTVLGIARTIAQEDGVRGFYRGTLPRMLTQAPAVAISWTAYEGMKTALGFASKSIYDE